MCDSFKTRKMRLSCAYSKCLVALTKSVPDHIYNAFKNGQCSIRELPLGRLIILQCNAIFTHFSKRVQ